VTTRFAGVGMMGQFGFFDADRRLAVITAKGDPLEMIAARKATKEAKQAAKVAPAEVVKEALARRPLGHYRELHPKICVPRCAPRSCGGAHNAPDNRLSVSVPGEPRRLRFRG
jgi:hypothetical protein